MNGISMKKPQRFSEPEKAILDVLSKSQKELDVIGILMASSGDCGFDEIDHLQFLVSSNKLRKRGFVYGDTIGGFGLTEKGYAAFGGC